MSRHVRAEEKDRDDYDDDFDDELEVDEIEDEEGAPPFFLPPPHLDGRDRRRNVRMWSPSSGNNNNDDGIENEEEDEGIILLGPSSSRSINTDLARILMIEATPAVDQSISSLGYSSSSSQYEDNSHYGGEESSSVTSSTPRSIESGLALYRGSGSLWVDFVPFEIEHLRCSNEEQCNWLDDDTCILDWSKMLRKSRRRRRSLN